MHAVDAFLKSKAKVRGAIRRDGDKTFIFDGIRYFVIHKGSERETNPEEVYGFLDWKPLEDKVNEVSKIQLETR